MPIYEYSCEQCKNVFEEWVRHIDDNVDQACPQCGAQAHRIVSNTSFVLKGGGWYVTDYGYRKGKEEKSSGGASSAATSAATSAAAPAPAAAPAASTASSGGSANSSSSGVSAA